MVRDAQSGMRLLLLDASDGDALRMESEALEFRLLALEAARLKFEGRSTKRVDERSDRFGK